MTSSHVPAPTVSAGTAGSAGAASSATNGTLAATATRTASQAGCPCRTRAHTRRGQAAGEMWPAPARSRSSACRRPRSLRQDDCSATRRDAPAVSSHHWESHPGHADPTDRGLCRALVSRRPSITTSRSAILSKVASSVTYGGRPCAARDAATRAPLRGANLLAQASHQPVRNHDGAAADG